MTWHEYTWWKEEKIIFRFKSYEQNIEKKNVSKKVTYDAVDNIDKKITSNY